MSADIRIDLCGKDIFTWNECERIGEFIVVERSMYKLIWEFSFGLSVSYSTVQCGPCVTSRVNLDIKWIFYIETM